MCAMAAAAAMLAFAAACAPRPLLERAIRARGGRLHSIARDAEADVQAPFAASRWTWRTLFQLPDRYAWSIDTLGEPNHYLFDGDVTRLFIGRREISVGTGWDPPLRSIARYVAVVNLDALFLPAVRLAPLANAELPPGVADGLLITFADDGVHYRIGFDARTLLVWVSGPVTLPPLGEGELVSRYDDFRPTHGLTLPFRTTYLFRGDALAEERTLAACPNVDVAPAAFWDPARIPRCDLAGTSGR
jgi:hypothetical protein